MRTSRRFGLRALLAALCAVAAPAFAAAPALECMKHNVPETLRMRQLQLQTESASGSSHMTGTVYARTGDGGVALNLQVDEPHDLRGAAFLFRQRDQNEEMYLFMPALNRVKRISGAATETSFFGSALKYSDLKALNAMYVDTEVEERGEIQVENAPARQVSIKPVDSESKTSTLAVLDVKSCLPLRLEITRAGRKVREFTTERAAIRQDEDRWYLAYGTMRDLETQVTTRIQMKELRGFDKMPVSLWNPSLFHQAAFGKK
ncbi:MAG: outer membrane lipoprotein-sorting protein [Sinimarinibacterium sp.]|jgi:hypothetical protein